MTRPEPILYTRSLRVQWARALRAMFSVPPRATKVAAVRLLEAAESDVPRCALGEARWEDVAQVSGEAPARGDSLGRDGCLRNVAAQAALPGPSRLGGLVAVRRRHHQACDGGGSAPSGRCFRGRAPGTVEGISGVSGVWRPARGLRRRAMLRGPGGIGAAPGTLRDLDGLI